MGTVSAAAEALVVHRATVIRHIDNLEASLGCKLFQRHGRGYTMTECGQDLLKTASMVDNEFMQFKARTHMQGELSGEFIVTSLEFIAPILLPALKAFQDAHPKLVIRYITSQDLFKLEFGHAHIAIRSGAKPEHPDYVVKPFQYLDYGLFAHKDYVEKFGKINNIHDLTELENHRFLCSEAISPKSPIQKWLRTYIPEKNLLFHSNSKNVQHHGVLAGIGIGAVLLKEAEQFAELIEVYPFQPEWRVVNWLVTHGDLHRSEKVQRFLRLLAKMTV